MISPGLQLVRPTWDTVAFVGFSSEPSLKLHEIINSVWIRDWRLRRTWIHLFGFTLMEQNFRCCADFTEALLYLGITNHKTWIFSRNLKFHSGWCRTRLTEFKTIDAREQLLQVLNKWQLEDLRTAHQRQQKQQTYQISFSGISKGACSDLEYIYILSYSHPILHFKSQFDPQQRR